MPILPQLWSRKKMLKCNSAFVFRECFVMPYNELRKDYLLNRWVVIATERGRRPTDFAKQKTENAKSAACPMCVGNESMTPPAVMLYLKDDNELRVAQDPPVGERPKNWLVRVVPNLFPAFTPPKQPQDTEQIFPSESFGNAIGHHEVIIEGPIHDEGPADSQLPQLELFIHAYIDRLREISSKPYVKYVSIFRNYGQQAGASLSHAHSQLIAAPMVPPMIQEEMDFSEKFYAEHGEVAAFAKILKASLKALKELVNDPPYNYGFHLALSKGAEPYYHWHLEVMPKLSIWAGFEITTGIYINTVPPETAAKSLREILKL
jgi:UDPglucose--hexose-1-phosphate uridylyltransferase